MLRIGKLTDYATLVLVALADPGHGVRSAQVLATAARLEPPTVAKLLKRLAQAGLVESVRGIRGGYRLARPAEHITVADVVTAMEGPIGMTECSVHRGLCDHETHCGVRVNWQRINQAIAAALNEVRLIDMVRRVPLRRSATIPLRVAS